MSAWLRARGFGPVALLLWSVSLAAWLVIWAGDRLHVALPLLCGAGTGPALADTAYSFDFVLRTVGWPALAGGAALMVVAMMTPALAGPFLHLWFRSLSRHRWRAIGLFVAGYLLVWLIASAALLTCALMLISVSGSTTLAGLIVAVAGLLWHVSPARARCLARCHLRPRLSIFGVAAFADPLRFGITLGGWCVATCWALMLLPLCWPEAHGALMAAGMVIVTSERTMPRGSDMTILDRLRGWYSTP